MKRHIGKLIALLAGMLLFGGGVLFQERTADMRARDWMRICSNAALLPGVMLTGVGFLVKISGEGLFDGIKYAVGSLMNHLLGNKKRYGTYYDYRSRRTGRAGGNSLIVPGLLFLALAAVLTVCYYRV